MGPFSEIFKNMNYVSSSYSMGNERALCDVMINYFFLENRKNIKNLPV